VVSLVFLRNATGQDFQNLDFESANLSPMYNDLSLGTPNVSLLGLNHQYGPAPLDGAYSIILQAFPYGTGSPSISQTGLVPASARSLFFEAEQSGSGTPAGILQVSLGGQNLPVYAVSSGANYTLYGADVSAFAGQTKQLTFLADAIGPGDNFWEIDDIQFSPSSVPEPSVLGLFVLGGLFFRFRSPN